MKLLVRIGALVCLLAQAAVSQSTQTSVVATQIKGSNGAILPSGQLCYVPSVIPFVVSGTSYSVTACTAVTSGILAASLPFNASYVTPAGFTYTLQVIDSGSNVVLSIPNVQLTGAVWNFDAYNVSASAQISGLGKPWIGCQAGARFIQNDAPLTNNTWTCVNLNNTNQWYLNPAQINGSGGGGGGSGAPNFLPFAAIGGATDAGISRPSPNVFDFGNGTFGDHSASVYAGAFYGDGSHLSGIVGGNVSTSVSLVSGNLPVATGAATIGNSGIGQNQVILGLDSTTNSINIIGSVVTPNILTLDWSGTLSKARQNASTVYDDSDTHYSPSNQYFTSANLFIPIGSSFNPTSNGAFGLDLTTGAYTGSAGGLTYRFPWVPASTTPVPSHCVEFINSNYQLGDTGQFCMTTVGTMIPGDLVQSAGGNILQDSGISSLGNTNSSTLITGNVPQASGPHSIADTGIPYATIDTSTALTTGNVPVASGPHAFVDSGASLASLGNTTSVTLVSGNIPVASGAHAIADSGVTLASVVQANQSNSYSPSTTQDFTFSTLLVHSHVSYNPVNDGDFGFDTTSETYSGGFSGTTTYRFPWASTSTPTPGQCAVWSNNYQLDQISCGGGGNTISTSLVSGNLVKANAANSIVDTGISAASMGTINGGLATHVAYYATSSNALSDSGLPIPASNFVGVTDSQELENKTLLTIATAGDCASTASPAVCTNDAGGSVAIPTGTGSETLVVDSAIVTANSEIQLTVDSSLGAKLGITCDSTLSELVAGTVVTARTAGTSFTITHSGNITTNKLCVSFTIIN